MKNRKKDILEYLTGYAFVLPVLIFILFFIAYPIIESLALSFFKWKGIGDWNFVGIKNYIKMFTEDRFFYTSIKNSILFSIGTTFGTILIGFILAVLIDLKIHFWKLYRFIFFLPISLSVAVVALLWSRIFDPYGLVNSLLGVLHLEELQRIWLGDTRLAMGVIIFVTVWQYSGFPMIFFLAGMQNIDEQLYEAAKIDGASTIRRIVSITLPALKNVFSVIIMIQLIFSFKVFDIVWIMTMGGPAGATDVLGTRLYSEAFRSGQFGYASVIAVIMFSIALIFSIIYVRISGYQKTVIES